MLAVAHVSNGRRAGLNTRRLAWFLSVSQLRLHYLAFHYLVNFHRSKHGQLRPCSLCSRRCGHFGHCRRRLAPVLGWTVLWLWYVLFVVCIEEHGSHNPPHRNLLRVRFFRRKNVLSSLLTTCTVPRVGLGACGISNNDGQLVVAVSQSLFE